MKDINLNLIFVEGAIDKIFIDAILLRFFEISDQKVVMAINGKDNLSKQVELKNVVRKNNNAKNLLIFDTDFEKNGGGRKKRLEEYNKIALDLGVNLLPYLLPFNDETEGEIEDLIKTCFNKKFDFFDGCWNNMLQCFENHETENKLNIPAKEGFLFSKIDLFKNFRQNKNWNYNRLTKYDFSDDGIWNFDIKDSPKLEKLVNFIKENLFDE
ncbi:hypothetical protein B0A58_14440 [Flavobacterium branchiophilum NBRC 15030 = ATCC 35035]|uniref:DUF4435 domain-containing protein n=1 Tax=Flavobacterium branchiophilum TaxID=55197 RepID=A0A543G4W4_9FLAO|nr:hypothetical protein [Flavobacterium branchiophilum]OXA70503.1 hypothetical protein B0A58_14440 [Flavobacterium branchiophilum NBRC 15030 = ATCC 35035]TQM41123.1 hypothetical protein BC670_2058 [Flavobacterium branchiophilum]GEM55567.1 hypothetical protein FB1_17880 [Flavobacterium branchiophilum NBRC 15030 = ATCC 35035]